MKMPSPIPCVMLVLLFGCTAARAQESFREITVDPPKVSLFGPGASYSLLIHGHADDVRVIDLTGNAQFRSLDPQIATVSETGVVTALSDGSGRIEVIAAGKTLNVPVTVEGSARPRRFNFENDIVALLNRFGCNASGCHGKAEGQNGFKLSVFGFDPAADYAALTRESRGRRVFPAAPEQSLLLAKASGQVAHGGGVRIPRQSREYETIRAWIAAGLPFGDAGDPKVVSIRVEPRERLLDMKGRQQLRVIARYADGREIDATGYAKFQSNNEAIAVVDAAGLVTTGESPGDVAVMASFMNAVDVFRAIVPRAEKIANYPALAENNFIDTLVYRKLRKLNILPSEPADEAEFLRRVYLDIIGTMPTADEARRFFKDERPDRRAKLVDELLARPEFADYWALKWSDLLRVDRQALGHKRAYAYYRWIRESFAENRPMDRFARELITAEGPLTEVGPANFFKVVSKPGEAASTLAQVFLGVRIACAECHHHPFDRWSQSDYYGMQAFLAPLSVKKVAQDEMLMAAGDPPTKNPKTGELVLAHPLGAKAAGTVTAGDRRQALADWMTAPDNRWFARNVANRTVAHFLGRGLVEPVDDVRDTNPPSNPELLDALAKHLVENKFDFRQLIRVITASKVYQQSSRPNATNDRDEQNYSRALFKRIDAEVLLDMVCQTTGVPEKFAGVPAGVRAVQLWDSKAGHDFLKLFGRPVRTSACACERNHEPGVAQVLHVLNSPSIQHKLSHEGGMLAKLHKKHADDGPLVDELYLTFFSRLPSEKEHDAGVKYLGEEKAQRRQAVEDLAWSMMNSLEFLFNH